METIRSIRTSPQQTRRGFHDHNSTLRLIAKLLREVVTTRRLTEWADVKDALRRRLSALRIHYTPREFDDAYAVVASNLPIVPLAPKPAEPLPLIETPVSREMAADICADLRKKLQCQTALKTMPQPLRLVRGRADRIKAAQMVAAEIVASVARCEALEAEHD